MKLKFDPSLEYQQHAVKAIVGVFNGQPIAQTDFELSYTMGGGLFQSELGVGNHVIDEPQSVDTTVKSRRAIDHEKSNVPENSSGRSTAR